MSLSGFILDYNSCLADMSPIAPPAKLPDNRARKRPSYLFYPTPSTFFCQLQPGRVPLLNSRHPARAGEKPFSHPLSLAVLPNTGMRKAKYMGIAREGYREESTMDIYEADVEASGQHLMSSTYWVKGC